ncbi:MAG: glucans biosynthesis glucosyltransferase MdoH [Candidatus Igneacidithiobacillus chanchocoensis]
MKQQPSRIWETLSQGRRRWLTVQIIIPAAALGVLLQHELALSQPLWLEILTLGIFVLLFAWISAGFWTALAGFWVMMRGPARLGDSDPEQFRITPREDARVAIIMPIYNEEAARTIAGLQACYRSLQRIGKLEYFDFFLLSDSRDPQAWIVEELAWASLCEELNAFGRIHYRRRPVNNHAKSGNVADFCRRWGNHYEYMVVLDADSVMSGDTLYRLLQIMEGNPQVGILQTQPVSVNRSTLYARVQQFSQRLYGPLFSAGLRFWQLGDGHFIGHNAMLRVAPFTEHCALPILPGRAPLGGQLLSHDFVEAALMARAGWEVWFLPDLGGSWEESPPTLIDDLKRDRRWAQGNLQHLRLLAADGLRSAHRFLFINGAMSFLAAPLWGLFLVLGAISGFLFWNHDSASNDMSMFHYGLDNPLPIWLFAITLTFLLGPKFLAVLWVHWSGQARYFGGTLALLAGVLLESLFAIILAPVRMVFHSLFVLQTLAGRGVKWGAQVRADQETPWSVALRNFGPSSFVGCLFLFGAQPFLGFWHFAWLLPIFLGLALSVPIAVFSSRSSWGLWARRHRLFLIPEEIQVPRELRELAPEYVDFLPHMAGDAFVATVVNPQFNAVHAALQRDRAKLWGVTAALCNKALTLGPEGLSQRERNILLSDRQAMLTLHRAVWSQHEPEKLAAWGLL